MHAEFSKMPNYDFADNTSSASDHRSAVVMVGSLPLGGDFPVRVQSMTNTDTNDVRATVDQVMQLVDAGCNYVRITTQGIREAENLEAIKGRLLSFGYDVPLIADVHFNPKAAELAATIVEKVRINPGNYTDKKQLSYNYSDAAFEESRQRMAERLLPLLHICQKHNTAIRIGTNHGSLSDRMLARFGNTPLGMVESALEFVDICRRSDFHQLVLSIKSSHVPTMIEANRLLIQRMQKAGYYYPVHLGVTEAGDGVDARVKSAAGIGSLLALGIGDTIRVSLTEDPVNEIPVALNLVSLYGKKENRVHLITHEVIAFKSNASGRQKPPMVVSETMADGVDVAISPTRTEQRSDKGVNFTAYKLSYAERDYESLLLKATVDFSILMLKISREGIWLENLTAGNTVDLPKLALDILQGLGLRYSKPEYIACPSCGRTLFNLIDQLAVVREKTRHLSGLKIAVMGCAVNGPGEMTDADYGYVGAGKGKVNLYKKHQVVAKNIPQDEAVEALVELIKQGGDWVNPEEAEEFYKE